MPFIKSNQNPLFNNRKFDPDKLLIGIVFDELYKPELDSQNPYFIRSWVYHELSEFLQNEQVILYPILV